MIAPTVPPQPADTATWQEWDIWLRRAAMANEATWRDRATAAQQKQAQAQADTAAQIAASVAAQNAATAAFAQPSKLSRAQMILDTMNAMPQFTEVTQGQQITWAIAKVDALLAKLPPGTAT